MRRRAYLGTIGIAGLAGCTGSIPGLRDDGMALGEPNQTRGEVSHPTHGDEFPDFSVPDPHAEETITREDLLADGPFVMTFIYTSCRDRCGELMGILNLIQHDAIEEGWDDDVSLVAMTWDPEVDDAATLREYGEAYNIDVEHRRFRFLRPETPGQAIDIVDDHFGVPAHHGADHDHHHDDEHAPEEATHYYMIFLVNEEGIVERSYPGPILFEHSPDDVIDDVRRVVT